MSEPRTPLFLSSAPKPIRPRDKPPRDLGKLIAELRDDPEHVGYAGLTDTQVARALNTHGPDGRTRAEAIGIRHVRIADLQEVRNYGE